MIRHVLLLFNRDALIRFYRYIKIDRWQSLLLFRYGKSQDAKLIFLQNVQLVPQENVLKNRNFLFKNHFFFILIKAF